MISPRRRYRLGAALAVGFAFVAILFMSLMYQREPIPKPVAGPVPRSIPMPKPKAKPKLRPQNHPQPSVCLTMASAVPDSYANQAQSRGAFGPPAVLRNGKVASAVTELIRRLCGRPGHGPDRRLYAAISAASSRVYLDPNRSLTKRAWVVGVKQFVGELKRAPAHLELLPANTTGITMYMVPKSGRDPFVGVTDLPLTQAHLLVVRISGIELRLKLECGFQPVASGTNLPQWAAQFGKP